LRVKNRMRVIRSSGSVRGGDGDIPAYSAKREADVALLGERAVAGVAVDLENALEAGKMRDRLRRRPVGRIDIGDRRRVGSAPGAIVSGVGPELPGLGASSAGIEHRRRRLVSEQFRGRAQVGEDAFADRPQVEGGAADPVGERRAIELDSLTLVDLRLAIERQVVGVFGDQHMGDRRLGRQAALDQPRRRWGLDHHVLAGATGVLGPPYDENPELCRDDVELLADVFADPVQFAATARAGPALDVDDGLDARQMGRKRAAIGASLACALRPRGLRLRLGLGRRLRFALFDVFEGEQQLVGRQRLGASAEAMALHVLEDLDETFRADALGDQHRLQRLGVIGQCVDGRRHVRDDTTESWRLRRFSTP
jgi:hypothetical protein